MSSLRGKRSTSSWKRIASYRRKDQGQGEQSTVTGDIHGRARKRATDLPRPIVRDASVGHTDTPFSDTRSVTPPSSRSGLGGLGFTVSQVVHDDGDLCQAITEVVVEQNAPITTEEFHILNRDRRRADSARPHPPRIEAGEWT